MAERRKDHSMDGRSARRHKTQSDAADEADFLALSF
jgi:hypothetical protein